MELRRSNKLQAFHLPEVCWVPMKRNGCAFGGGYLPKHVNIQKLRNVTSSVRIFTLLEGRSDSSTLLCDYLSFFLCCLTRPHGLYEFPQFHGHLVGFLRNSFRVVSEYTSNHSFTCLCLVQIINSRRARRMTTQSYDSCYSEIVQSVSQAFCFAFAKGDSKTTL